MRITAPSRRRLGRLLAATVGAVALGAVALPAHSTAAPPQFSAGQLAGAHQAVGTAAVAGTAWRVDAATNRVVVTVDSAVTGAEVASLQRAGGGAVRIERVAGTFTRLLAAGDAIYGTRYRCSLGFNAVSGSTYYFLTAGHCTDAEATWYTSSARTTVIGPTAGSSYPGNDYGLVRYANTSLSHPGGYTVADAFVGERVTRDGSTTGVHSGTVTALNVTVRYRGQGGGTVSGLIQTTVCAEGGDSGGPLYDGSKALGLTSGGSGDCRTGGTTFFQPAREAANAYGVTIY